MPAIRVSVGTRHSTDGRALQRLAQPEYHWLMRQAAVAYEEEVHALLTSLVGNGSLGIDPRSSEVIHLPRYWSARRSSEIEFDVAVEVRAAGESDPLLIWIWECKLSSRPVSVDEVEEFWAKLQQVGSSRTKGTMVSSSGFQRGAVSFSRSEGLGLARLVSGGPISHLLWSSLGSNGFNDAAAERFLADVRFRPPGVNFVHQSPMQRAPSSDVIDAFRSALSDDWQAHE